MENTNLRLVKIILKGKWAKILYKTPNGKKIHSMWVGAKSLRFNKDFIVDTVFSFIFKRSHF